MATQNRVVQAGDTVGKIAKEFGVPTSAVTGFRSNDPNTIFPGETLTIQVPDVPQDTANTSGTQTPQIQTELPQNAPLTGVQTTTPQTTVPNVLTPQQPTQSPTDPNITQDGTALVPNATGPATVTPEQPTPQVDQTQVPVQEPGSEIQPAPTDETVAEGGFTLPSGLTIPGVDVDDQGNLVDTDTGEIVTNPAEDKAQEFFSGFGLNANAIGEGFNTNPFGTLQAIVENVMQLTGLPDLREQITTVANQIEEIENERDRIIEGIQDNPFLSAGSKQERIQRTANEYDNRLNARINKLTLLQSTQEDAREQARFVASTAIGLFNQERQFQADQIESQLDRAERQLEAERRSQEDALDRELDLARLGLERRRVAIAEAGAGSGGGTPSSSQFLAAGFAKRLEESSDLIDQLGTEFTSKFRRLPSLESFKDEDRKKFEQAERNFINATLRRESGAAIADSEFDSARLQYIPQAGDTAEVLQQKSRNRDIIQKALEVESGRAFDLLSGELPPIQVDISDLDFSL